MRMPRTAAAASAALLLALAPAASASIWPAPQGGIRMDSPARVALRAPRAHAAPAVRACMKSDARSRAARWLAPVACEHAPRSEILVLPLLGG